MAKAKAPLAHHTSSRDNWMVTYGSLLTGVLAFFLLLVGKSTSEAESIFRFSDNLTAHIGQQISQIKAREGYDWLYVENTGNKGIKLLIPSEIDGQPMFYTASAQINDGFYPILQKISGLISKTDIPDFEKIYARQIRQLRNIHQTPELSVRIEGHTDRRAISTSQFRDNWDLSTARAYTVMKYFQSALNLKDSNFSMAGYAYFHPLHSVQNYDENRRVEIYIKVNSVMMEAVN